MTPSLKRLSWALALSLGLNVFLLGFVSARWFQRRAEHIEVREGPHGPPRHLLGAPPEELKEHRRAIGRARTGVGEALAAEPFDRERLARALEELRTTTSRGQLLLHERLLERAASLSLDERRELANSRLLRGRPRP